jgi:hypothetical protein
MGKQRLKDEGTFILLEAKANQILAPFLGRDIV